MNEMQNETENKPPVGEMRKRRETMADGKRYIIYYTFGEREETAKKPETGGANENV